MEGETRTITEHPNLPRDETAEWDFGARSLPVLLERLKPDILLSINDIQMINHIPKILCPDKATIKLMDLPAKKFLSKEAIQMQVDALVDKFKERYPRETKWICFTPDTEVLTPDGIKNITDIKVNENVYTLNPDTNQIEITPVVKTIVQDFDGNLVSICGLKFDFLVTPDHNFYLNDKWLKAKDLLKLSKSAHRKFPKFNKYTGEKKEWFNLYKYFEDDYIIRAKKEDAKYLDPEDGWVKNHSNSLHFYETRFGQIRDITKYINLDIYAKSQPRNREQIPLRIKWTDFLKLAGWYISEGFLDKHSDTFSDYPEVKYESFRVNISQFKPENRRKICKLLDDIGIRYHCRHHQISFNSRFYYNLFRDLFHKGLEFNSSKEKYIPKWIFRYDDLDVLFQSLMDGDGHWDDRKNSIGKYYTSSEELRDDMIILGTLLGMKVSCCKSGDECYVLIFTKTETQPNIFSNHVDEYPYSGKVYCITTKDNHIIFAGRNKKFNPVGQCLGPQDGLPPMPNWSYIYEMADQVVAMSKK